MQKVRSKLLFTFYSSVYTHSHSLLDCVFHCSRKVCWREFEAYVGESTCSLSAYQNQSEYWESSYLVVWCRGNYTYRCNTEGIKIFVKSRFKTQKCKLPVPPSLANGERIAEGHSYFCSKSASWCVLEIPVLSPSAVTLLLVQYLNIIT